MAQPLRQSLHALAERLGYTVRELAGRLTLAELRDWLAYDRLRREEANGGGWVGKGKAQGQTLPPGPLTPASAALALGVVPKRKGG